MDCLFEIRFKIRLGIRFGIRSGVRFGICFDNRFNIGDEANISKPPFYSSN